MKKIIFLLVSILATSYGVYAQHNFPAITGPVLVTEGSPETLAINDAANGAAVPAGLYSEFTVTADWVSANNAWASEADLTMTTSAGSVVIDPPTTGGASSTAATTLTFSGAFTANYDPSVDGSMSITLNQSYSGSSANWSNIVVTIIEAPTCLEPSGLSASAITTNSADLEWTENGTATTWDIEWGTASFTPTGTPTIVGTTSNPYPLTSLTTGTSYDFYVRADCGVDGFSTWAGPYNFTTPLLVSPPLIEGFTTTSTPAGWDTTGWSIGSVRGVTGNPGNNIYKNIYSSSTTGSSFTTPAVSSVTTDMILSFDYIVALYSSPYGPPSAGTGDFVVEVSTDYGATYTVLETVVNDGTAGWQTKTYPLTAYAGEDVVFKITGNWVSEDWDLAFDNFFVDTAPTCDDPSNLTATNITATTADLGWTENGTATTWDIEVGSAGFTPTGTPTTAGVTSNPYTASSLNGGSSYDFYVRADCGVNGFSIWSGPYTFCTAVAAPWLDDVEAHTATTSLGDSECWTTSSVSGYDWNIDDSGSTPSSFTGPSGAYSGDKYFYVEAGPGNTGDIAELYTPLVDVSSLTTPAFKFYYHMYGSNMGDLFIDVHDGTTWTNNVASILGEQQTSESDPWESLIVDLSTYTGVIQVRFRAVKNTSYEGDISLDNIEFMEAPSCFDPTNLTATNITATSADLGWTESGTATTWDIEWGTSGFTPTGTPTIAGTTSNPYPLTGLTAETSYDFYVRADCGSGDLSAWVGPYSFTTPCAAIAAPWNEDFENAGSIPDCWEQGAANAKDWEFSNTAGSNHIGSNGTMSGSTTSGGYFAWLDDSSPHEIGTTLESPLIDVSGLTVPLLSFYLISDNEGNTNVDFSVDVWDGAAWNTVFTNNSNTLNGGWEKFEVYLSSLTITGPLQLRFIVDENNGTDFYDDVAIDDISVVEAPACPDPSLLTATNITATSADLGWQENGSATTWDIEYGAAGFTPTGTPTVSVTTNPYTLSGLTPVTEYDYYVRADCGTSGPSNWSGPFTFQTECTAQLSGTYTIGATGDYATFTDAVSELATCGISGAVTFNVLTGSGPYTEQIIIPEISGASAVNTITFNGNGETLTSATTTGDRSLILLNGADYVTVDNLSLVTISDSNNFVIQLTNDADFNTINNCTIDMTSTFTSTATSNAGIVVSGSLTSATSTTGSPGTDNTFTGNTIIGGYYGLTINGESSASNSMNNVISDNVLEDFRQYGMYLRSITNATISNNDISQPTRTNPNIFYGIYFVTSGENNLVEANKIYDAHAADTGTTSAAYGIYHSSVDASVGNHNMIINNLIYNFNGSGTNNGIHNVGSDGVYYYHNTISLDNPNSTGGLTRGIYQSTAASDIEFKNNIVTVTRGGTGTKYALYFNTSTSTIASDNNVLYVNAAAGTNGVGYYSTTGYTTLADWQTANGGIYDNASVDADPLYVNSLGGDFTPSNSAVNNTGAALGVLTDINGDPRDAVTPDAGAYEFTPPACPQPSDLIATNITATTADLGWTENGTATTWDIELGPAGFTPTETPTTAGVTTNPYTQTGLTELTEYDFYVRADCGSGDLSVWVGPYTFTTGCIAPLAGTYTIDAGGTGDYTSLSEAVNSLVICGISAPVTFNVVTGSGPYDEQIVIPEIVGASAANTITFNGNGETMTAVTASGSRSLFLLDGADYVTIEDFNLVTQSDLYNFVIQLTNNADFNTVDNCVIDLTSAISSTSATNAGIVVSGSLTSYTVTTGDTGTDNTFTNNTITGGSAGIAISGGSSISSNNIVENNVVNDSYSYGIYFRSVSSSSASHNSMSRPLRTNTTIYSGLYFITAGENNMIESNRIFNTHGGISGNSSSTYPIYHTGVDATPGNENWVVNNLVYDVKNNGTLYGIYNSSSDGVFYYHNTISLDDPDATGGLTRGIYQTTAASGIEVKNNIISITRGGTGTKYALYYNTSTSTIASDNNVLYVNAPAGTNGVGYYSTTGYTTLADWQTANGGIYDNASVDANPNFANPSGGQFSPTNAAVDNIGTAVGVLVDIDGNIRSVTTPDAGAYEFTPPTCFQPSALTATNITNSSADLGWTESGTATMWDIEWGTAGFTPTGTPTIAGTTSNPYPLTGLTANTAYEFYVRADCGSGDLSLWSGPYMFMTECDAVVAPWTEGFENGGSIPDCWKQGAANAKNWEFANAPGSNHIGNNGVMDGSTTSGGYFAWVDDSSPHELGTTLESPFIDVSSLIEPMLSFYLISHNEGNTNVDFSVDVWDGAAWNSAVFSSNTNTVGGWELIEVSLTSLTITGDIKLRFIVDENNGTDFYDDVAIDDVSVYEGFVCVDPSNLTATNLTTSSADLGWTENGTATTWDIEWGTAGFTPTGTPTIAGVTTNPYTLTGLTHDTMYEFYVRADCGSLQSDWVGPFTFETLQVVCDAPTGLTEVDVTDTTVEVSWTASATETGGYEWFVFADGDNPATDPSLFDGTVATGVTTVIITGLDPETDYDIYVSTLCDQGVESSLEGPLNVLTDLEPCEAPTNLVLVDISDTTVEISWTLPVNTSNVEGYGYLVMNQGDDPLVDTPVAEDFVAGATTTTTIITGLTANTPYDIYLVSVCDLINEYYSDPIMDTFTTDFVCEMPTTVTTVDVDVDFAEFSWTASATETNGYEWAVFNTGDDPLVDPAVTTGTVATGVTSVIVTGLTPETTYDFYVRTDCDPDGMSDWVGPLTFTTDQSTGVNDFDINSIVLYPNPMVDVINISSQVEIEKVVIYSLTGQKLIEHKVGSTETQINVSNFATGPYLLHVTTSTGNVGMFNLIKK